MTDLRCTRRARIVSPSRDCFRFARDGEQHPDAREVDVTFTLQVADGGCYLRITPDGCFTADHHHESLEAAIDGAERHFDVPRDAWKPVSGRSSRPGRGRRSR